MKRKMCGRCYDEVENLFPSGCAERPELLKGQPLGQYHCPDCGAMIMAGAKHPDMCQRCIDREHPAFDSKAQGKRTIIRCHSELCVYRNKDETCYKSYIELDNELSCMNFSEC